MAEKPSPSNRSCLRQIYGEILDNAMPGDILFFISDTQKPPNSIGSRIYRSWLGINSRDTADWHTSLYVGSKKDSSGAGYRPLIVHSNKDGTVETWVSPKYFTSEEEELKAVKTTRIEIIQNPDLTLSDREQIVQYVRSQVGKLHDGDGWRQDAMTYLLGIRSKLRNPEYVSCHGLALLAYGLIGINFPHSLQSAPNIVGRFIGHPLGHPKDHVDLKYNYLRDHHIYRDSRFNVTIAVEGNPLLSEVKTVTNPGKYSWDTALQIAYGYLNIK
jgi:hypothetical protein